MLSHLVSLSVASVFAILILLAADAFSVWHLILVPCFLWALMRAGQIWIRR